MIKKIFGVVLLSCCVFGNAFAGGECQGDDLWEAVTEKDPVRMVDMPCGREIWDINTALMFSSTPGMIKICRADNVGPMPCGKSHFKGRWEQIEGSCIPEILSTDKTMSWEPYSAADKTCWNPKCSAKGVYFVGKLSKKNDPDGVDYTKCQRCTLNIMEIVTADPTEYSFIKMAADPTKAGPIGGKEDSSCFGYHTDNSSRAISLKCMAKGYACASGNASESKGADGDYYVKCGA